LPYLGRTTEPKPATVPGWAPGGGYLEPRKRWCPCALEPRGLGPCSARATITALLVVTGPTAAQEIGTGLEEATEKVGQATKGVSGGSTTADAPPVPAAPTSDDDSQGHETQDPAPLDHASGGVVDIQVAGEDLVTVGATDARIEDDGEASGDVTLLAIGGSEIVGASLPVPRRPGERRERPSRTAV
jgi:hypothetical protein